MHSIDQRVTLYKSLIIIFIEGVMERDSCTIDPFEHRKFINTPMFRIIINSPYQG